MAGFHGDESHWIESVKVTNKTNKSKTITLLTILWNRDVMNGILKTPNEKGSVSSHNAGHIRVASLHFPLWRLISDDDLYGCLAAKQMWI